MDIRQQQKDEQNALKLRMQQEAFADTHYVHKGLIFQIGSVVYKIRFVNARTGEFRASPFKGEVVFPDAPYKLAVDPGIANEVTNENLD